MRKAISFDWFTVIPVILLFSIGLFVQYSTTPFNISGGIDVWIESIVIRQLIFFLIAVLFVMFVARIDPQIGKTLLFQIILWIGSFLLLIGLFVFGPIVNATHRWYQIGQFLFQPSEFVKIAIVLWTSYWISQEKIGKIRFVWGGIGLALLLLLILFQPDFGATIITLISILAIIFIWGIKYKLGRIISLWFLFFFVVLWLSISYSLWLLLLLIPPFFILLKNSFKSAGIILILTAILGVITLGIVYIWNNNFPEDSPYYYVKNRVEKFISDEDLFQIRQSKIAIGSGQLSGKGIAQGTQSRLKFLPEYTTDFIIAAYIEERGFLGAIILFLIYIFLFGRMIYLAMDVDDEYARLVIVGLTIKMWFETFVNIGMNMGSLPTKGVALPFVSYGGSSLLANMLIIGIVLTLYRYEAKRAKI